MPNKQSLKFLEMAYKVLKENMKPMSGSEIWNDAMKKGYIQKLSSSGKTPEHTLLARLYTSANDPKNPNFRTVGVRPKRFYIPGVTPEPSLKFDEEEILEKEESAVKLGYKEKDLHPVLAYYIKHYLGSFPKTINHTRSRKKEFGAWVHPDMVACFFPQDHWEHDVYDLSQLMGEAQIGLYSFELKTHLSFANLRESFFQAVSNSSWAHQGYLVTAEIKTDQDFLAELDRLSAAFGIGVILLDLEDPDNSEEIYPAEQREYIDWETVNKLTMNADFRDFITRVKNDIASKEVREEKYDTVPEAEELIKFFKKRK